MDPLLRQSLRFGLMVTGTFVVLAVINAVMGFGQPLYQVVLLVIVVSVFVTAGAYLKLRYELSPRSSGEEDSSGLFGPEHPPR